MKNLTILSLLMLAIISITACKKDAVDPLPRSAENFLFAKKGNALWVSKFQEVNTYNDSTYLFGRVGEENLVFRIKYTGKGKYVLTNSQARYTQTVGGDVVVAEYNTDPAAESVLNITGYDADKKIYTGDFSLNLKLGYRYNTSYPEKLAFISGSLKITQAK